MSHRVTSPFTWSTDQLYSSSSWCSFKRPLPSSWQSATTRPSTLWYALVDTSSAQLNIALLVPAYLATDSQSSGTPQWRCLHSMLPVLCHVPASWYGVDLCGGGDHWAGKYWSVDNWLKGKPRKQRTQPYLANICTVASIIMLSIVYVASFIHKYENAWNVWFVQGTC